MIVDIVFDGPPAAVGGRFVEVENLRGESVAVGRWIDRGNGSWALRVALHDGNGDALIGDEHTFNSRLRYYRAAGDTACEKCGLSYFDHPIVTRKEAAHYGCELHVLCNSDRVKL